MKKQLLFLLVILFLSTTLKAQDRQTIQKVMDTQRLAWNRGDIPAFMQTYWHSDSLMFVGKNGPNYGWQNTLSHYKKSYPDKAAMGTLTFNILQIKLLDATNAFVLGGWQLKRAKDAPGGYFTLWFKKIKGEWKIVVDHTS